MFDRAHCCCILLFSPPHLNVVVLLCGSVFFPSVIEIADGHGLRFARDRNLVPHPAVVEARLEEDAIAARFFTLGLQKKKKKKKRALIWSVSSIRFLLFFYKQLPTTSVVFPSWWSPPPPPMLSECASSTSSCLPYWTIAVGSSDPRILST